MSSGQGTITFDFGSAPGTNVVTAIVSDAGISAGSKVEIYMMGTDSTPGALGHNAYEHSIVALGGFALSCISVSSGSGFTAQAASLLKLTGTFKARYVWAD